MPLSRGNWSEWQRAWKTFILWIDDYNEHHEVCSSVVARWCKGEFLPSKCIQRLQPLAARGGWWEDVVSDWCSGHARGAQLLHNKKTSALLHWRSWLLSTQSYKAMGPEWKTKLNLFLKPTLSNPARQVTAQASTVTQMTSNSCMTKYSFVTVWK